MNKLTIILSILLCTGLACSQTNPNMTKTDYSVEIIRYLIPEEQSSQFENAYAEAASYLKSSPFCLGYRLLHGDEEPENYILIIHWTSKEEHMNGFRKSGQFPPFFNLIKPFYNNIKEMKHYTITDANWTRE